MTGLKATQLDGYGDDVIVTECIAQGTSGRIVYSVFANEEDARSVSPTIWSLRFSAESY